MGEGGDAIFDIPSQVVIDVARWQPERLDDEVLTRASIYNIDPNALLAYAKNNVTVSLADNLANAAAFIRDPARQRRASPWLSLPPRRVVEWFSPEIREELALRLETTAYECNLPAEVGVADYIARTGVYSSGFVHRYMREAAQREGTVAHAPLLDEPVMRACLDTPAFMRSDPRRFKKVLGDAFAGVLPDSLVRRASKGAYNGEFYQGLRVHNGAIRSLLKDSRLTALGILHSTAVAAELSTLQTGAEGAGPNLMRAVVAERWLRSRDL
jgi:asparagine synthase (glutamine-hydrolysing)